MALRKGKRLHAPCRKCSKMFERFNQETLCKECYLKIKRKVVAERWKRYWSKKNDN